MDGLALKIITLYSFKSFLFSNKCERAMILLSLSAKKRFFSFLVLAFFHALMAAGVNEKYAKDDVTFIILGATGDLTKRDLIPALYRLFRENKLERFAVIGAALPQSSAHEILESAREFVFDLEAESWEQFSNAVHYAQVDFGKPEDFLQLKKMIDEVEQNASLSGNRLVYCATSCNFFEAITQNLERYGIIQKKDLSAYPWHRIAYEKPFGYDQHYSRKLEASLQTLLSDEQMYRIDHFLYTQAMSNVISVRALNPLLKNMWNNKNIERVDILFNETLSVSTRGKLYDALGVMLDVVQNHVFQMLAVAAIDIPEQVTLEKIKEEKIKLLKKVRFIDGFFGQYDGYRNEKDVAPDSVTETYASLKLMIDTERWKNVPFYLTAGKCLDKTEICIRITFKDKLNEQMSGLTIWVAPNPSFELALKTQNIGIENSGQSIKLTHVYEKKDSYSTKAYASLFEEIIKGNRAISVDFDEIDVAWQLTDFIKAQKLPLYAYAKGSKGPELK
jgi:glucose-6-phosphate 1-dehydrogenase